VLLAVAEEQVAQEAMELLLEDLDMVVQDKHHL
jgi:hypothetical protein